MKGTLNPKKHVITLTPKILTLTNIQRTAMKYQQHLNINIRENVGVKLLGKNVKYISTIWP